MNRRTLLRGAGTAATAGLAGCFSRDGAKADLEFDGGEYGRNDDGYFQYGLTVTNTGTDPREATVRLTGTLNGEPFEKERDVELAAGESAAHTISFDVKAENVTEFSADLTVQSAD